MFGDVVAGEMELSDAGRMIIRWWKELPGKFPSTSSDCYVVMPNHFHGIIDIDIQERGPSIGERGPSIGDQGAHAGAPLPTIVQWFKTMTTNEYIRGVKSGAFQPFEGRLWQRNYYEHVIRSEDEWDSIRLYICQNPANWHLDGENPSLT